MYCFKCGKEIRDDALFCQYCGTKQANSDSDVSVRQSEIVNSSSNNDELDREALRIYLGNVLSLECIKSKYERQIAGLEFEIQQIKNRNCYGKYPLEIGNRATKPYVHFWYDGLNYYLAYTKHYGPCLESQLSVATYTWYCLVIEDDIDSLKLRHNWEPAINHHFPSEGFFVRRRMVEKAIADFSKAFTSFQAESPFIFQDNMNRISAHEQKINGISKELEEINQLLNKAYAVNIIPAQFRYNIHAIYYLHDFVSTSCESFTTALLHFDLDEIKVKLDRIISQQESIIIQNAVLMAQNENLARQNQKQLEKLSKIERNTSQAAQYAQIAANNAETCAWFNMANYIETHL